MSSMTCNSSALVSIYYFCLFHLVCMLCLRFVLTLSMTKSPMPTLFCKTFVCPSCICCSRVWTWSFLANNSLWTASGDSCSPETSTTLRTFSSFSACSVQYAFMSIVHNNIGDGVSPVNIYIGHLKFPALLLPRRCDDEWMMTFGTALIEEGHFITGSFRSDIKARVALSTSFHKPSVVSFAQVQYAMVKWWRIPISWARLVVSNVVKYNP